MEIAKELKEKLLKAGSEEEVSALLGEGTTEDQAARMWQEIQAHRQTLEEVDDGELEAVSGGNIFTRPFDPPDRDYDKDGCAASVEYGSWCGSNDACTFYDVTYTNMENACLIGVKGHDWGEPWQEMVDRTLYCTKKPAKDAEKWSAADSSASQMRFHRIDRMR